MGLAAATCMATFLASSFTSSFSAVSALPQCRSTSTPILRLAWMYWPMTSPSPALLWRVNLPSCMFSPTEAMSWVTSSPMMPCRASASAGLASSTLWATFRARASNCSPRATKSVSQSSAAMATCLPSALAATVTRPSLVARPDFLAALAMPFWRSQSTAFSRSPSTSTRAFLQSIMPAPVFSRSSFTKLAEIAIFSSPCIRHGRLRQKYGRRKARRASFPPGTAGAWREESRHAPSGELSAPATVIRQRLRRLQRPSAWPLQRSLRPWTWRRLPGRLRRKPSRRA